MWGVRIHRNKKDRMGKFEEIAIYFFNLEFPKIWTKNLNMSQIHHFFSLIGMWGVNLCLFFTRKSNLFFKKQVFKEKLEKNTSEVENNENFQNFGFQNILSFSHVLNQFQLQVRGPSEQASWDNFFDYSNIYLAL